MIEQWIRAKYEKQVFMKIEKQTYLCGHKAGYLFKRGRDKKYNKCKFILDEPANELKYFIKEDVRNSISLINYETVTTSICISR